MANFLDDIYNFCKEVVSNDELSGRVIKGPSKSYYPAKNIEKFIQNKVGNITENVYNNLFSVDDAIRSSNDIDFFINNFDSIISKISRYEPVVLTNSSVGALVFCDLAIKLEHSGIFIGDKTIVELDGDGNIRKVDYSTFLNDSLFRTGINIFTFTDLSGRVLGSQSTSDRARFKVGEKVKYNLFFENCHKFSAGCMTGDFENFKVTFTQLLNLIRIKYGPFKIRRVFQ